MKSLEEKIEEIEKKMDLQYRRGQNNEPTNDKYRELLAEKFKKQTP